MVRNHVDVRSKTEMIGEKFIMTNVENSGAFLGMGSELNPTFKLSIAFNITSCCFIAGSSLFTD